MIVFLSWSRLCLAGEVADHPSRHSASRQLRRSPTMADLVALALKFTRFLYFSCFGHIYILFYLVTLFKDDEESNALQILLALQHEVEILLGCIK
jgi:hypothetical protein